MDAENSKPAPKDGLFQQPANRKLTFIPVQFLGRRSRVRCVLAESVKVISYKRETRRL